MSMIIIRKMREEDVPLAARLEEEVFSMPWSSEAFLDMVKAKDAYYLVAVNDEDGELAGICGLLDMAGDGFITNVAVAKRYRRHGIGRSLVAEIMRIGKSNGIGAFTLEVRVSNEAAVRMYESLGFKNEGIRPGFYEKPKEDAYIYWNRNYN